MSTKPPSKKSKPPAKPPGAARPHGDAQIHPGFGKPLGPTLDALVELGEFGGELFYLLGDQHSDPPIAYCREHYSVEILGRSHDQLVYFGVPRVWDAPTVDQHPIVIVDKAGVGPHVFASNLAEFLGDVAFSPGMFGQTRHEWERARRESLEDHGEAVATIQAKLCSLPGVVLPKAPWNAKKLPTVALRPGPAPSRPAPAKPAAEPAQPTASRVAQRSAPPPPATDDLEELIDTAYGEAFESLLFHPSPDEIDVTPRGVAIRIALDAPEGTLEALQAHEIVAGPLGRFSAYLRARLAGTKVSIEVVNDCLSDSDEDAWRRLKIALVDQAKQPALFEQLRAKRGRSSQRS